MGRAAVWFKLGLLALGLAGTACGSDGTSTYERTSEALELWRSKQPAAYTYVYERGCYCAFRSYAPVRVVVEGGKVVSARFADGSDAGTRGTAIEALHGEILGWFKRSPELLRAEYDDAWGYPREALVDVSEAVADDEFALAVTCFAANAESQSCPL